ncbi:MAG: rhomboid family intramembrane serine protease [Bacteroidales bacterium]|nr:rhomboid family intramembrane serine protease [Bacteroidales bacterium]
MGIYDRDYYRDDDGGWLSGLGGRGVIWIIGVTVGVYILQLLTRNPWPDPVTLWGAFQPELILQGQVWRIFTAELVQDSRTGSSLISLAFGMYFVFIFGGGVEGIYGKAETIWFYVTSAIVASLGMLLVYLLFWRGVLVPPTFGSGPAITALLVLFACHHPTHRILVMFVIPMPIWLLVAVIVLLNTLGFFGTGGATAFSGTLTAVGFAFLYYWQQLRISTMFTGLRDRLRPQRSTRLRLYDESDERFPSAVSASRATAPTRTTTVASSNPRPVDEHLEAKLDQILEKVSLSGRESLSPEENELLLRASEIYKRRRDS